MIEKIKLKRTILILLIIINCITIFRFSAQKADDSSKVSDKVVSFIVSTPLINHHYKESEISALGESIVTPIRKLAHFSIYTCLGALTYLFVGTFENISKKKQITYAILFCFFYACSDEFHQRFVPGRSGEFRDICIDTCGALFGNVIVGSIVALKEKYSGVNTSSQHE